MSARTRSRQRLFALLASNDNFVLSLLTPDGRVHGQIEPPSLQQGYVLRNFLALPANRTPKPQIENRHLEVLLRYQFLPLWSLKLWLRIPGEGEQDSGVIVKSVPG